MIENVVEPFARLSQELPWVMLAWFTVVGGCIGSFMNVVAYRLPLGMSLSNPPSRCPQCEHPIRWHDNLPVLGWLKLRGRCRDCREPIPARYACVEALFMVVFAAGWWRYVMHRNDEFVLNAFCALRYATLASTLIGFSLIQFDRQQTPYGLFVPAMIVPWLIVLIPQPKGTPILEIGAGTAAGVIALVLVAWLRPPYAQRPSPSLAIAALAGIAIGSVLGLRSTLGVAVATFTSQWLLPQLAWSWTLTAFTLIALLA